MSGAAHEVLGCEPPTDRKDKLTSSAKPDPLTAKSCLPRTGVSCTQTAQGTNTVTRSAVGSDSVHGLHARR
jgi:hypothetical protein